MDTITIKEETQKIVDAYLAELSFIDKKLAILIYSAGRMHPDLMIDKNDLLLFHKDAIIKECKNVKTCIQQFTEERYVNYLLADDQEDISLFFYIARVSLITYSNKLRDKYRTLKEGGKKGDANDYVFKTDNTLIKEIIHVIECLFCNHIIGLFYKLEKQESITKFVTDYEGSLDHTLSIHPYSS